MMSMLKQFFCMFGSVFSSGNEFALALNAVARSTHKMAAGYEEDQDYERKIAQIKRDAKIAKLEAEIKAGTYVLTE